MQLSSISTRLLATAVVLAATSATQAVAIYGVRGGNTLFAFDSSTPSTLTTGRTITGLAANEVVRGIDVRPATGELYAVGSLGNLYTLNGATGAATFESALNVQLNGTSFGIDFNPVPDRLRIVSDVGQNLRINVDTGATTVDGNLSYASGGPTNIVGAAYTNSAVGPAPTTTTLYDIDSGLNQLVTQAPPNDGNLVNPLPLGVNTNSTVGFDILTVGADNTAYASLTPENGLVSNFYSINLTTGAATLLGQIGSGFVVDDIAVVANPNLIIPEPASLGALALGALGLVRRRRA